MFDWVRQSDDCRGSIALDYRTVRLDTPGTWFIKIKTADFLYWCKWSEISRTCLKNDVTLRKLNIIRKNYYVSFLFQDVSKTLSIISAVFCLLGAMRIIVIIYHIEGANLILVNFIFINKNKRLWTIIYHFGRNRSSQPIIYTSLIWITESIQSHEIITRSRALSYGFR